VCFPSQSSPPRSKTKKEQAYHDNQERKKKEKKRKHKLKKNRRRKQRPTNKETRASDTTLAIARDLPCNQYARPDNKVWNNETNKSTASVKHMSNIRTDVHTINACVEHRKHDNVNTSISSKANSHGEALHQKESSLEGLSSVPHGNTSAEVDTVSSHDSLFSNGCSWDSGVDLQHFSPISDHLNDRDDLIADRNILSLASAANYLDQKDMMCTT
jgi:hypothetical protein